jgi:hypothetical protein
VTLTSSRKAYFLLNAILAGVILFIMGYSAFYSPDEDKYPVPCVHEKITGEPCPSCGLSHAFSLIIRGRIDEAQEWNSVSLRVFSFFLIQLLVRVSLGIWVVTGGRRLRQVTITDAILSSAMTLFAFYPFLRALWLTLFR